MNFLTPLGFLGFIGIIALIIIYIIKPNYQNKIVSSTFIWKMSLKYKKKRIPISKLRNILLFICQLLILTAVAFILTQPMINSDDADNSSDEIIIIDTSASMHSMTNQETRIERAVDAALSDATKALNDGKKVSVIVAADSASFLVQQADSEHSDLVYNAFDQLSNSTESFYAYGKPDIDGAMLLAEQITLNTEKANVTLYTDTTYLNAGKVNVYDVTDISEWNAAILDVRATLVENYYRIEIDVASYGADSRINVQCEIFNANDSETSLELETDVYCNNDETVTVVYGFITDDMPESEAKLITENIALFSYDQIYVHVSEYDSLSYDNQFYLYGGKKPTLKIQYYSTMSNTYWSSALLVLQDMFRDSWNIEIDEVITGSASETVATEGYDIYIFEHTAALPKTIPSDGIVIYSDPTKLPSEAGVRFGSSLTGGGQELFLSLDEDHTILDRLNPEAISVTQFTEITSYDGYSPLISYEGKYPLLLLKEDVDQKIVLMPFSLHYSNLAILPEFPILLKNIVNYFFPVTVDGTVFETGDSVSLNSRVDYLEVVGPNLDITLEELPCEIKVSSTGTYTLTQPLLSGDPLIESIYVKIPAEESNICLEEATLTNPAFFESDEDSLMDLLFMLALAAMGLLFIEWWLKSREQY